MKKKACNRGAYLSNHYMGRRFCCQRHGTGEPEAIPDYGSPVSVRHCFNGLISIRSLRGITKSEVMAGGLMGLALFAGFAFQIVGLQYTTPSKNAFF